MQDDDDVGEAVWAARIDALRDEMGLLMRFCRASYKESKLTWDDYCQTLKAFNDVIRRSGLPTRIECDGDKMSLNRPDDALTYALYRDGLHQLRRKFAELHPELVDELNRNCPPQRTR
jgi:hypothetical protein